MNENLGNISISVGLDFSELASQLEEIKSLLNSGLDLDSSKPEQEVTSLDQSLANLALGVDTLQQSFSELKDIGGSFSGVVDAYNQYEASMNGIQAVAKATGNSVSESMSVVKDATTSGLISQSDAAAAVKNLELYGYSAQEAAQLIDVLTNSAVYNRQANYSVGEAVRVTTEGIRMENSVLSDAAGVNKNIAQMHEEYAKSLGTTTEKLTQEQKAQAVLNGVLNEGGIFAGNAEQYTDTLAGAQSRLSNQIDQLHTNMGRLFNAFTPIISGIADWLSNNQQLAAGIFTFITILGAGGGLIFVIFRAVKAINTIKNAIIAMGLTSKAAAGGIAGLVLGIAALATAGGVAVALGSATDAEIDLGEETDKTTESLGTQAIGASNTAKKIADLQNNIEKLTREYRRDLKQIAVNHEENLSTLNQQIEEANIEYRRAIDERTADFNITMAKQERSHQETVNELMMQLSFLQQYNNEYNRQKLAQVQFALAKEQTLYQQETAALQEEINLQNQADKEKLDAKLASLQQELSEEMAFMEKHREDLNSVRDVILLDEIESLQERYNEQKKSYESQIAEAGIAGTSIGDNLINSVNDAIIQGQEKLKPTIKETANVITAIFDGTVTEALGNGSFWDALGEGFDNLFAGNWDYFFNGGRNSVRNKKSYSKSGGGSWATGGYTGTGDPNDIAGVVHKGEYVIPANMVDQTTGTPKVTGNTQNITINVSGTFATSSIERRKVAEQIASALSQVNQARIG